MRTKGDLCTLSKNGLYGGSLTELSDTSSINQSAEAECGSFTIGEIVNLDRAYSFSAKFKTVKSENGSPADWLNTAGIPGDGSIVTPSPYPYACRVASDEFFRAEGAYLNTLNITAPSYGAVLEISADFLCKSIEYTETGSLVAKPQVAPFTYSSKWAMDGTPINAKSWTLSINNTLATDGDLIDGIAYSHTDAVSTEVNMALEFTISSVSHDWDFLKQAESRQATSPTHTLTWSDGMHDYTVVGWLNPMNFPTRSQGTYDETISFKVKSISYEAV